MSTDDGDDGVELADRTAGTYGAANAVAPPPVRRRASRSELPQQLRRRAECRIGLDGSPAAPAPPLRGGRARARCAPARAAHRRSAAPTAREATPDGWNGTAGGASRARAYAAAASSSRPRLNVELAEAEPRQPVRRRRLRPPVRRRRRRAVVAALLEQQRREIRPPRIATVETRRPPRRRRAPRPAVAQRDRRCRARRRWPPTGRATAGRRDNRLAHRLGQTSEGATAGQRRPVGRRSRRRDPRHRGRGDDPERPQHADQRGGSWPGAGPTTLVDAPAAEPSPAGTPALISARRCPMR